MARVPKRDDEREEVLRRFFALSEADRLEVYQQMRADLGQAIGRENAADRVIGERAAALEALRQVAGHLRTRDQLADDQAPTAKQFDQAASELGLDWNRGRVIRAFETWRNAKAALLGGRVVETPARRRFRLQTGGRGRTHQEHLDALRAWLRTTPSTREPGDYDAYVKSQPKAEVANEKPLPRSAAITTGLGIPWARALAVAEEDLTLAEAREAQAIDLLGELGDKDLVGANAIQAVLGYRSHMVEWLLKQPGFPAPVVRLGKARVRGWYLGDLRAYAAEKPVPARKEGEAQEKVIDAEALAKALGRHPDYLRASINKEHWHRIPRPDGRIGNAHYWWRKSVAAWRKEHQGGKRPN